MSYDIDLVIGTDPVTDEKFTKDWNLTWNYSPALDAAGHWRPNDLHERRASDAAPLLQIALDQLEADPKRFIPLILGGGTWGNITHLKEVLTSMLVACRAFPNAIFEVSG